MEDITYMRPSNLRDSHAATVAFLIASRVSAQNPSRRLSEHCFAPEQRADDLVHRMTVEEKVTQLVNQSRAIQRLNIPAYDWWSEALHGVAANGTTEFPEPSAWLRHLTPSNPSHGHRHRHRRAHQTRTGMRDGHSDILEGLDFWAPNINIFRDPRWGRGQETYGEDPFLTRAPGRGLRHRHAGRQSEILSRHLDAQALRRAQRAGTDPPHGRREGQQA